jgi:Protein of unknown function (DUF2752)
VGGAAGTARSGGTVPARLARPVTGALGAGSCAAFLYAVNPHTHQVFLPCPFRAMTGLYCPACGGLRMVHDALRGQLAQALHDNALAVPAVTIAALAWLNWTIGCWRGRPPTPVGAPRHRAWVTRAAPIVMAAWTVLRNLPFAPFTALRP